MEALERMFEDSEDEVTTDEVDTEDEELEDSVPLLHLIHQLQNPVPMQNNFP